MQGDSGRTQANMVTEVYSHIIDDDRRKNALAFCKDHAVMHGPIFLEKQALNLITAVF